MHLVRREKRVGGRARYGDRQTANARVQGDEVVVETLGADRHACVAGTGKDPAEDARPHRRRVQHGECGEQQRDDPETSPPESAPPDEREHPLHHCILMVSSRARKKDRRCCGKKRYLYVPR